MMVSDCHTTTADTAEVNTQCPCDTVAAKLLACCRDCHDDDNPVYSMVDMENYEPQAQSIPATANNLGVPWRLGVEDACIVSRTSSSNLFMIAISSGLDHKLARRSFWSGKK